MSAHVLPKSTYYAIFGALMVLTGLTVGVSLINLGSLNFPIAIGVAITKATLVVLFFMHVRYSSKMTKMIVAMAIFFLLILLGLTMSDYLTRGWFSSPRGTSGAGTSVTITHDGGTLRPSNESRPTDPGPRESAQPQKTSPK